MRTTITDVDCRYGAPMGRVDNFDPPPLRLRLRRVHINRGGYDSGGAYWGLGQPLYEAFNSEGFCTYLRASSRQEAKNTIRAMWPDAQFVR